MNSLNKIKCTNIPNKKMSIKRKDTRLNNSSNKSPLPQNQANKKKILKLKNNKQI